MGQAERVVSIKKLVLTYKTRKSEVNALTNINLEIEEGEFVCLLGPSGCGKSTLLKIVAGFVPPTTGQVLMDGREIAGADWHRGVVFQQPALYPWLSVEDNIKFGLKMRHIAPKERDEVARYYLEKVGLQEFGQHKPYELSGGMKQRIAIARALANNPRVLLMDEPFGALDALTREQMQNLLRNIWWETGKTILFITHDVDEALALGTRVLVMSPRPGRIVQEFNTSFTRAIDVSSANEIRFSKQFANVREQVMNLINNIPFNYKI